MKILHHHAASLMYEKVKSLAPHHSSWRCIYINLSSKRDRHTRTLHSYFVIKTITDMLAEEEGYIYLCHDGDIFILFQGSLRRITNQLSRHFDELRPENIALPSADSPFIIFDLSMHWQPFVELCQAKTLLEKISLREQAAIPFAYAQYADKSITETFQET